MRKLQKLLFPVLTAALLGTTVATPATVSAAGNISLTPYLKMHPLLQYGMQAEPLKLACRTSAFWRRACTTGRTAAGGRRSVSPGVRVFANDRDLWCDPPTWGVRTPYDGTGWSTQKPRLL